MSETTEWNWRDDGAWWREERGVALCVRAPTRLGLGWYCVVDALAHGRDAPRLDGNIDTMGAAKDWCDHWARVVLRWIDDGRKVTP